MIVMARDKPGTETMIRSSRITKKRVSTPDLPHGTRRSGQDSDLDKARHDRQDLVVAQD
jgi:hypothetical protein